MPYSTAYARLPEIFRAIGAAGTPPKFHNEFLKSSLGFTSSNDRAIVSILRKLGFIGNGGEPTQRYNDFKGHDGGKAVARGLREGWADLFMADQKIYTKNANDVSKRVVTLTGANERTAKLIASTFVTLCGIADWSDSSAEEQDRPPAGPALTEEIEKTPPPKVEQEEKLPPKLSLHHDIHIHLPTTSDATVYRAVFQAIKAELL